MENPTAFDLKAALERWGEELSHLPNFRSGDLQELESHLRDSIAAWQGKGLSDEEAFLIATRRLGAAPTLASEFAKVNGKEVWLDRLLWMAVGVQLLWLLSGLSSFLAGAAVIGGLKCLGYQFRFHPSHPYAAELVPGALLLFAQLAGLGIAIWGGWSLVLRKGEILSSAIAHFLRRPFLFGMAALAGSVFLARSAGVLDHLLLTRWFSMDEYQGILICKSLAFMILSIATGLTFATFTVFLARRRLGSRALSQTSD